MDCSEYIHDTDNWAEPSVVEAIYHEDYMYLRETEMLSRDEFILHLKKMGLTQITTSSYV